MKMANKEKCLELNYTEVIEAYKSKGIEQCIEWLDTFPHKSNSAAIKGYGLLFLPNKHSFVPGQI